MTKDEEIKAGLIAAGVPHSVHGTTLALENALELRGAIAGGSLPGNPAKGLYVYPTQPGAAIRARSLFYLAAKELFLSGVTVHCLHLFRLGELLASDRTSNEASRIDRVRVVFVSDFYERGAPSPFASYDAARVRYWVKDRFDAGFSVSFLSDAPTDACKDWWPQSFIKFVEANTIRQAV